jgi:hypothetical protein
MFSGVLTIFLLTTCFLLSIMLPDLPNLLPDCWLQACLVPSCTQTSFQIHAKSW